MKGIFIRKNTILGIIICFILATISYLLTNSIFVKILRLPDNTISPITLAIIGGLFIRQFFTYFSVFDDGYQYCIKKILKVGIILLGIRLSLLQMLDVSLISIIIVIPSIFLTLTSVLIISKHLKFSSKLSILIAVGTSICGASAIAATSPAINAKKEEMSYAIATITLFGLFSMICYPYFANFIFSGNAFAVGLFLGSAIHDTSQVTGAAMIYDQVFMSSDTLKTATITKLLRNTAMVIVIPLLAVRYNTIEQKTNRSRNFFKLFPMFILGFIFFVFLRSFGDFLLIESNYVYGYINVNNWMKSISILSFLSKFLLIISMAAIGLSINFNALKNMGLKIFYFGFTISCFVGIISIAIIKIFII